MTSSSATFVTAWKQFYQKAHLVVNHGESSSSSRTARHVTQLKLQLQSILQTIPTLLSTQPNKQLACQHGALRLTLQATRLLLELTNHDPAALRLTCRAVQSCVGHNPVGREQCRGAGVLEWLDGLLLKDDPALTHDVWTTTVAVCLGHDLNALYATVTYGAIIEAEYSRRNTTNQNDNIQQTLTYLHKLVCTMWKEQHSLLQHCGDPSSLFPKIQAAEAAQQIAVQQLRNHQYHQAERNLTRALIQIQHLVPHTNLLNDLRGSLLDHRSATRLRLSEWQGVLDDTQVLLEYYANKEERTKDSMNHVTVALHTRRVEAFSKLGQFLQAQEALDAALCLQPENKMLRAKWNQLQLAKQQHQQPKGNTRRRPRHHQVDTSTLESWLARVPSFAIKRQLAEEPECTSTTAAEPGTCVTSLYGRAVVQEVRSCGTTKIQLDSWSAGPQPAMAYLRPEFYTIVTE